VVDYPCIVTYVFARYKYSCLVIVLSAVLVLSCGQKSQIDTENHIQTRPIESLPSAGVIKLHTFSMAPGS